MITWQYKALAAAVLLAVAVLWLNVHDYRVFHDGYRKAMEDVREAAAKREAEAAQQVAKNRSEHEKKRKAIRAQPGYNAPVSPLVGNAVRGVYKPADAPAKR
jgi:hydrogenase maturation factor